jgi:hypothetical protein
MWLSPHSEPIGNNGPPARTSYDKDGSRQQSIKLGFFAKRAWLSNPMFVANFLDGYVMNNLARNLSATRTMVVLADGRTHDGLTGDGRSLPWTNDGPTEDWQVPSMD